MRINRRPSGGRGEYEISGPYTPLNQADLIGPNFVLKLAPDILIDSGATVRLQGGKPRIRLLPGTEAHPHLQIAAALLMPHPVREDKHLGGGAPVLQRNRYMIEQIDIPTAKVLAPNKAVLTVKEIIVRNSTYHANEVKLRERLALVRRVWNNAQKFPLSISSAIAEHRAIVHAGGPIPQRLDQLVYNLGIDVAEASADLGISHSAHIDVLPPLVQFLDSISPAPPIDVDDVDPQDIELRHRVGRQYRTWASHRGAASAQFRKKVRESYNATCIVCGLHLPPSDYNRNPGVDAAHILPWSKFDLDDVSNGLCLCKLHHWAFDEGLISVKWDAGRYYVEIPDVVVLGLAGSAFSLTALQAHAGEIPIARLPSDPAKRPRQQFLEKLREFLS